MMPYVRVSDDSGNVEVNKFTDNTGKFWIDPEDIDLFKASLPEGWTVEVVK